MTTTTKKTTSKKPPAPAAEKKSKTVSQSAKSDQKRGEIVRVATEILNAKSYAQATVIDIAAQGRSALRPEQACQKTSA